MIRDRGQKYFMAITSSTSTLSTALQSIVLHNNTLSALVGRIIQYEDNSELNICIIQYLI